MGSTYLTLVNKVLVRLNEVPLDLAGDGFESVRNMQALAKQAINSSIREILQRGQEWPFLKVTYEQALTAGTSKYSFPSNFSTVDWESFYIKSLNSINTPGILPILSFDAYNRNYRPSDDTNNTGSGIAVPNFVFQTNEEKFGVTPVPNDTYTVEYVYYQTPDDLTLYSDTTVIPLRFDHVIVDGAMVHMMSFRSNEQSSQLHKSAFEDGIKNIRRLLLEAPLSVSSTMITSRNYNKSII